MDGGEFHVQAYPSVWREVLAVFGAALAITALVCMAAGLVLGAHLIVEKVTQWL